MWEIIYFIDKQLFLLIPQVIRIISQLRKLEFLNLSGNYLSQRIDDLGPFVEDHCKDAMVSIKKLVLNNTSIPLQTVYSLLSYFTGYVCETILTT